VILILLAAAILMFVITHLAPGNPINLMAGESPNIEQVKELEAKWGLNKPIIEQLYIYVLRLLTLDLGQSFVTQRSVSEDLITYLPATLELTLIAIIIATIFGVILAMLSVAYKGKTVDHFIRTFSVVGVSIPVFWFGLLLLLAFYMYLGIFPGGGRISSDITPPNHVTGLYLLDSLIELNWKAFLSSCMHLILPAVCLSFSAIGRIARMARASMLAVHCKEYVRVARAKGLRERAIMYNYIFKNSMISTLTMIGEVFGELMGGSVLTETIFSWPGLGRYAVQSAMKFDYNAITGFVILATFIFALTNLVVDLAYGFFDPRISYE